MRRALGWRKRDRIRYSFRANGEVVLQRVSPDPMEEDPALAPFLALLERDSSAHPERLQPIGSAMPPFAGPALRDQQVLADRLMKGRYWLNRSRG